MRGAKIGIRETIEASAGTIPEPALAGRGASTFARALRSWAVVWGCELVIARVSCEQQSVRDLLLSAVGLACVGLLPLAPLLAMPIAERWRRAGIAIVTSAPALVVALGLAGPPAYQRGRLAVVLLLVAFAALGAHHVLRAWRGGEPVPGPAWLLGVIGCAAVAGWALARVGFPPPRIWAPALLLCGAVAALAQRTALVPAIALLVLAVARWPVDPPAVAWSAERTAPDAPDIVLLTVDTLRADAAEEMRSVQRLAERGVTFSAAQAAAPWTLPSMATVLTGLPVGQHGAGRWSGVKGYAGIHESRPTLAMQLHALGYDTAGVVAANGMVDRHFGFERGFATYDYALDLGRYALPRGVDRSGIARPVMTRIAMVLGLAGRRPTGDADWLVTRAIHILERRRDRPIFLWIHFLDTHLPYRHAEETDLPWGRRMTLSAGSGKPDIVADPYWATEEGRASLWTAYRHEAGYVDRAIGRLLDWLDLRSRRDTLILLTSDHGEEFFEHGDFEHGHALYQEIVGIPLVMVHPSDTRPAGSVEERVVGHVDLAPTILAAAGAPDPALPGQDLARPLDTVAHLTENMLVDMPAEDRYAVRQERWKAVFPKGAPPVLYDLGADPAETRDASDGQDAIVQRLAETKPEHDPAVQRAAPLDDEVRDALRALGYLVD